jgi:hypothetical protein
MALVHPPSINIARDDLDTYSLPDGFPEAISSDMVWTGADLADERRYVYQLTPEDLAEIDVALNIFKGMSLQRTILTQYIDLSGYELDGDQANKDNFPLPNLQHTLEQLSHEVYDGKGLFLIRGLTPDLYSVEDSTVIFMGLQAYIAEQKARQDCQGNMIGKLSNPLPRAS